MDILDRLRPRWRRSDPEVRAAAVREMGVRDQARLETIARSDPDARVRRIAIKKLEDAERLDGLAQGETDADLRAFATERARQIELCLVVEKLTVTRDLLEAAKQVRTVQQEWAGIARDVEPREDVAHRFHKACDEILDEAGSRARREDEAETARRALQENLAVRTSLCERVEGLDDTAAPSALDDTVAAWDRLAPVTDDGVAALARRLRLACANATARRQQRGARQALLAKLEAVVVEAEALAAAVPVPAEKTWQALEKRWTAL